MGPRKNPPGSTPDPPRPSSRKEGKRTAGPGRSSDRLATLLSETGIGLWDWDLQTNSVWYSPEWKAQLGYAVHEVSDDFEEWRSRVHPDDLEPALSAVRQYLERPWPGYRIEFRMRHRDGSWRWIEARASLTCDPEGRPARMLGSHLDITSLKTLELERERLLLKEQEAHFRFATFLESMSDGFVALDRDWRYTYVNRRAAELLGRDPESLTGRHIWTEFPEGIGQPFQRAYQRVMENRVSETIRAHYAPWDRWFENRIYPAPDGITIFFTEITEQVRSEHMLRNSEERLRSILDSMFAFVGLISPEGTILEVNRSPLVVANLRREEVIGRQVWEAPWFTHSEATQNRVRSSIARAAAGETVRYDERIQVVGGLMTIDLSFVPLRNDSGAITGIVGSAVDVTEHRTVQTALRESEARLRLFIAHAPAALAMFDREMHYLAASHRWLADYGLEGRDLLGRSHYEVFPEIPSRWREAYRRGLEGEILREEEDSFQRVDGRTQWLRWEIHPWRGRDGSVGGIVVFIEDITALRESRERLRQFAAALERVREEERSRVAREIHDELGGALTALKIDLAWLARHQAAVPEARSRIHAALQLVDETADATRRIAADLRPRLLDDLGLEAAVLWQLREFAGRTGIATTLTPDSLIPEIDPERATTVFRILQELLTNVARHARARSVTVRLSHRENTLTLAVTDDGRGISEDQARGDRTFGLTGIRERAMMWGGAAEFQGHAGVGTTVEVNLPIPPVSADLPP